MKTSKALQPSRLFLKSFWTMLVGLAPVWGVLTLVIGLLGVTVGLREGVGWLEGLYFGFVTATTIGYGDIVPSHTLTRFLSVVIGIIGIINGGLLVSMAVNAGKIVADRVGVSEAVARRVRETLDRELD